MQVAHGRMVLDPRVAGAARRGGTPEPSAAPPSDLSDRERDVLVELARGLSTAEIATALGLSANTVKTHLRGLFRKLGAHNRVQALSAARERGLLKGDSR